MSVHLAAGPESADLVDQAGPPDASSAAKRKRRRSPWRRFLLHYVEMVLVMLAGMAVFVPVLLLVAAAFGAGRSELQQDAPALVLLGMGLSMTAPMVGWMRFRGHSWAANREMAGAMILPTLATVGLLWSGAVEDLDTLLGIQHMAMFPAMFVVMLWRREEYSHGTHG
jgi:hypothetical protein